MSMCEVTSPDLKRLRAVRLACGGAVACCCDVRDVVLLVVSLMVGAEEANLEFKNHGYYVEGNFTKTIETAPAGKVKVFFDNTIENLKNVYCYIYNGTEASVEWPGVKMQLDEETEYNGKKGYYSLEVPADFLTGCFVINNGEAGSTLQGETVYVNGKVVTAIENTTITAVKKTTDDAWYSITGVRISKPAQPGLYIHNGKKVIIRK
jgi:hypothetical protein